MLFKEYILSNCFDKRIYSFRFASVINNQSVEQSSTK
nr:MAG TPA: hypothetical protein [Caudoviricetes sp.]